MGANLYLFGQFRLENGRHEDVGPRRAKTKALLAYIALTADGTVERERAAELIWSQGTAPLASLRQSIRELHETFDKVEPALFNAEKQRLSLDLSNLWVDAREAERCATTTDLDAAIRLAELPLGELLEPIAVDEVAFQEWLRLERSKRLEDILNALGRALDAEMPRSTETEMRRKLATALLRLSPTNERAHRALILSYLQSGDRGSALRQYQICKDRLAEQLNVAPSDETEQLAQQVIGNVDPVRKVTATINIVQPSEKLPATTVPIDVSRFLTSNNNSQLSFMAMAFEDQLRADLLRYRWLDVRTPEVFKGADDTSVSASRSLFHDAPAFQLRGSIFPWAGSAVILIQLHDIVAMQILWMDRIERHEADFLARLDETAGVVALAVARAIQQSETRRVLGKPLDRLSPFECVLRAVPLIYRLTKVSLQDAKELLNRALEQHPHYAAPYAWSAFLWSLLIGQGWIDDLEAAREEIAFLIHRSLEIDQEDSLSLAIAGHLESFVYRDVEGATEMFDRAFRANPNSPYAWGLSAITQCYAGRPEEGLRRLETARQVMPFDPYPYYFDTARAIASAMAGNHEQAVRIGNRVLRNNANFTATYRPLIASLGHLGRVNDAAPLIAAVEKLDPAFSVSGTRGAYTPLMERHGEQYLLGLKKAGVRED